MAASCVMRDFILLFLSAVTLTKASVTVFTYKDVYVVGKATRRSYTVGHVNPNPSSPFDQFQDSNAVTVELKSIQILDQANQEILGDDFSSSKFQFGESVEQNGVVAEGRQMSHTIGSTETPEALLWFRASITKQGVLFPGTEEERDVKVGSVLFDLSLSRLPEGECDVCGAGHVLVTLLAIRSASGVTAEASSAQKTLHLAGDVDVWFPMKFRVGSDDNREASSIAFEETSGITYVTLVLPLGGVDEDVTWRGIITLPEDAGDSSDNAVDKSENTEQTVVVDDDISEETVTDSIVVSDVQPTEGDSLEMMSKEEDENSDKGKDNVKEGYEGIEDETPSPEQGNKSGLTGVSGGSTRAKFSGILIFFCLVLVR